MPAPEGVDDEAKKILDAMGDGYTKQIKDLLKKLAVQDDPDAAFRALEVVSRNLKYPRASTESVIDPTLTEEEISSKLKYCNTLCETVQDPVDPDGGLLPICALPNFNEESDMLSWAGIGFSESQTFLIMSALRHFGAKTEGLKKVRFWGKVLGTECDYYVAEAQTEAAGEADPDDPSFEPLGTGSNTFAYWVATDLYNPVWTRLPDAYPHRIVASRKLKKILSGNLEDPVVTYPYFDGREKDYLRSIIARITCDSVLNVKGYLSYSEEGDIQETEEFTFPDDVSSSSIWVHCTPHILGTGRCSYLEVDAEAEPDKFAAQEAQKSADPEQLQLRDVSSEDWAFQKHRNNVTSGKSLVWPGAFTVYKEKTFTNIYVGYGVARSGEFYFTAPPDLQEEPVDIMENPEPTPVEGPPAAEEAAAEE